MAVVPPADSGVERRPSGVGARHRAGDGQLHEGAAAGGGEAYISDGQRPSCWLQELLAAHWPSAQPSRKPNTMSRPPRSSTSVREQQHRLQQRILRKRRRRVGQKLQWGSLLTITSSCPPSVRDVLHGVCRSCTCSEALTALMHPAD